MGRPNLVHLQTLLQISRLGSFTAAARHFNTTQSAISARMRQLEENLGHPLFTPRGRNLILTVSARQLVERLQPLMEELDFVLEEAGDAANPRGTLRIGLAELSIDWFSRSLGALHSEFPRLQFALTVDLSANIQSALEEGLLDIAVLNNPEAAAHLEIFPLGSTALRWVCAVSLLPGGEEGEPSLRKLMSEKLIWVPPGDSPSHSFARQELIEMDAAIDHLCTTNKGLLEIALQGGGLVLLPDIMVRPYLESGQLVCVGDAPKVPDISLFLAVHRHHQWAIQKAKDFILKTAQASPL